jgi:hypothetical protein
MRNIHLQLDPMAANALDLLQDRFGRECSISAIVRHALRRMVGDERPPVELLGNRRSRRPERRP